MREGIQEAVIPQMAIAVAHHDAEGDLLEETLEAFTRQLEISQQLSDPLVAPVVLAIGLDVANPKVHQRGDVLETKPGAIGGDIEPVHEEQLPIVRKVETGCCDARTPGS